MPNATHPGGGGHPVDERLDVGFVPSECPGADGTGAVHTSTLLIENLSLRHDLTVYVSTQMDANERTLPARDRVEYVLHDGLSKLPHPIRTKLDALREETDALNSHDLVHAYSPAFVPVLADLDVPTLATLNSYVPVCPKADMLYHGERKCSGPATGKCVECIAATALTRREGVENELRAAYTSLGRLGLVATAQARSDDISAYRALSPHLEDDYVALGFPGDRIRVIPHFYDEQFCASRDDPVAGGRPDDPIQLLYVGALQDIKGVDVLVRALAELRERGLDVALRIAGSGPSENALRSLAARLGVAGDIDWLGYVDHDELPAEYGRADVFVYPGRIDEPFGRVMLEALSSGTPVVAADVGSTDYIVGDAGVRFSPEDPVALADACVEMIENYEACCAALPDELEKFDREVVLSELLELYADVADGQSVVTT